MAWSDSPNLSFIPLLFQHASDNAGPYSLSWHLSAVSSPGLQNTLAKPMPFITWSFTCFSNLISHYSLHKGYWPFFQFSHLFLYSKSPFSKPNLHTIFWNKNYSKHTTISLEKSLPILNLQRIFKAFLPYNTASQTSFCCYGSSKTFQFPIVGFRCSYSLTTASWLHLYSKLICSSSSSLQYLLGKA